MLSDYNYLNISLEKAYGYEPIPKDLPLYKRGHILGLECNMWTEGVSDRDKLDYQVFPRLCAYAEVGWTQKQQRNYKVFTENMGAHYKRLDNLNIEYCKKPNPKMP